ncbi:putative transporter or flippase transmembrane protein [Scheffersomyces xylosifermentans]|uniref:putative transporter or flippase transmembrane protein n=1 Tax=Scheffersomyces xylosifermentans TaxID=1304137 RepID=UPI00315CF8A2
MNQLPTWSPSSIPSRTTLSSIATTHGPSLSSVISSVSSKIVASDFDTSDPNSYLYTLRAAQASLTIVQAEVVIATATDQSILAQATQAIFESTFNLVDFEIEGSSYHTISLNAAANIVFLVLFGLTMLFTIAMLVKSRYHWYNVSFVCGLALEFIGFLGRTLSLSDMMNSNYFLVQLICLTIAPAFIMAGIYFLFGQLAVLHGREFSILKPMWYSYLFIGCDILALLIQSAGGAIASIADDKKTSDIGTDVTIAGIAIQVLAMSVFLVFWFNFLHRVFFKKRKVIGIELKNINSTPKFTRATIQNFLIFLLNGRSARQYKVDYLDQHYNQKYVSIRARKLFSWFPLVMTISVIVIYIRCVYRLAELAQGYRGYLITHEVYLMVLDALMIAIVALIFVPFHPYFVLGSEVVVTAKSIKRNEDQEGLDSESTTDSNDLSVEEVEPQIDFDSIRTKLNPA